MRRILLALALVALVATTTSAATKVWWEYDGVAPGGFIVTQGVGTALNITAPAGTTSIPLVMVMSNDTAAATQGLTGYRVNLWRGANLNMSVGALAPDANFGDELTVGLLNPLAWTGTKSGTVNAADMLLSNYGRGRASGQTTLALGNSSKQFIKFTLVLAGGNNAAYDIYQTVGGGLYGTLPPTGNTVFFGSNAGITGATAITTWAAASQYTPVIHAVVTPEPATLVLFGLGLVGLIRRR